MKSVLCLLLTALAASATELTSENYAAETDGKRVMIKVQPFVWRVQLYCIGNTVARSRTRSARRPLAASLPACSSSRRGEATASA